MIDLCIVVMGVISIPYVSLLRIYCINVFKQKSRVLGRAGSPNSLGIPSEVIEPSRVIGRKKDFLVNEAAHPFSLEHVHIIPLTRLYPLHSRHGLSCDLGPFQLFSWVPSSGRMSCPISCISQILPCFSLLSGLQSMRQKVEDCSGALD